VVSLPVLTLNALTKSQMFKSKEIEQRIIVNILKKEYFAQTVIPLNINNIVDI